MTSRSAASLSARPAEHGFALILAILALMLLTFLGLTLAVTTSTELQIATNYRWGQQALYNAEAGVEVAKLALKGATPDLSGVLPQARPVTTEWFPNSGLDASNNPVASPTLPGGLPAVDAYSQPARNLENYQCDKATAQTGFGAVLVKDGQLLQYVSQLATNVTLNGAFTAWVRRPTRPDATAADGRVFDDQANTSTVLTVEGIAPFAAPTGNFQRSNLAVRYVQVILTQSSGTTDAACTAAGGGAQKGFEVSGSNFGGACNPVSALFGADELASVD